MPKSFISDETFNSNGDGSYDVSFFAHSVLHSCELSKRIFGILGDKSYSELSSEWSSASPEERNAYLIEYHEAAHHGLLFSTPAGTLLWRLNQVLCRDIQYLSTNLKSLNLNPPSTVSPRRWVNGDKFCKLLEEHNGTVPDHKAYIRKVISAVEELLLFREVFFGVKAAAKHADMSIGDLLTLCNFVYPYMAERCAVVAQGKWSTRLKLDAKVFPPEKTFNVMDIAECHAIAKELYLLRAMHDRQGFDSRLAEAIRGQFGPCLEKARNITDFKNEVGFSPHMIQLASLLACSGQIDVSQHDEVELFIEEQLPWWRFSDKEIIFSGGSFYQSIKGLETLSRKPLIGAGSGWLRLYSLENFSDQQSMNNFITTLTSFGLDVQVNLIHQGAHSNLLFLMDSIKHANQSPTPAEAFDKWSRFLFLNNAFVEYRETFFLHTVDVDSMYENSQSIRELSGFSHFRWPLNQLLAHIFNGGIVRRTIATFSHIAIPSSKILSGKLERFVNDNYEGATDAQRAAVTQIGKTLLTEVFEKRRDIPFGIEHLQEIDSERFV
jgi:hypothetical protein